MAFQRRYVSYIKRCDELERKLRYIKGEIDRFGLDTEVDPSLLNVQTILTRTLGVLSVECCPAVLGPQVPGGFQKFLAQSAGGGKDARSGAYVLEQLEVSHPVHLTLTPHPTSRSDGRSRAPSLTLMSSRTYALPGVYLGVG